MAGSAGLWHRLAARLFSSEAASESVATRVHFDAGPGAVWDRLLFYEEVRGRPPLLLRAFLPRPLGTEGDKTRAGERVRCRYSGGDLVKRITAIERDRLLEFEVIEQCLGIEGCVRTQGGSYGLFRCGDGTDVELATNYEAYLRPRQLWRPLEALLVSRLHGHILAALGLALIPVQEGPRARHRDRISAVDGRADRRCVRVVVRGAVVQDSRKGA